MSQFLDSPAPFKPINPHGRKASMPDGWKSPFRNPDGSPVELAQVVVEQTDGSGLIAAGPAMNRQVAETLKAEIVRQIKRGRETKWSNPSIVTYKARPPGDQLIRSLS